MNATLASSALLGFGNQTAAEALAGFGETLNKMYETQVQTQNGERESRKSFTDEYNKDRRAQKKRESDTVSILEGLRGNQSGSRRKSGAKKSKGSLMNKILLGAAAGGATVLVGKALYDYVSDKVATGLQETFEDMAESVADSFKSFFEPVTNMFDGGEDTDSGSGGSEPSSSGTTSNNKTQVSEIPDKASNKERYNIVYQAAKEQGDPIPELTAAQAMFESNYLRSTLAVEGNNPFGQSGAGDDGKVDYQNASIVSTTTGWAKYTSIEAAVSARIKRWSKTTPQGNPGYGTYKTPMAAMKGIMENYAPAADSNNHASYLGAVERIMKDNGHNPHRKLQKGGRVDGKKAKGKKRKGNGPHTEDAIAQGNIETQKRARGGKIFLHWAASRYTGASPDYHATIQGDGSVAKTRDYNSFGGGHTSERNSEGIGISLAAMAGATTNDFGDYPVKKIQYENMAKLCAQILTSWGHGPSYVTETTVPTHAEAGRQGDSLGNYGPVAWGGNGERWDLWKLYENDPNGSGGSKIRNMIKGYMSGSGDIQLESEDGSVTSDGQGNTTVRPTQPSSPTMPVAPISTPQTFDDALNVFASDMLAPLFGVLGALSGNPISSGGTSQQSGGESPSITVDSTPFTGTVSEQAKTMHDYIVEKGYSSAQAKGIVANIQRESGFRTDAVGDSGTSFGLFQWHAGRGDRMKRAVANWASNWKGQIDYALQEHVGPQYVSATAGMDAKDAAYWWMNKWEIPADRARGGPNHLKMNGFIDAYKFQRGGMVGQQINTGSLRGIQSINMAKLRESSERMKRRGPKVVYVTLPPMPTQQANVEVTTPMSMMETGMNMVASELADYTRRLAMGALA